MVGLALAFGCDSNVTPPMTGLGQELARQVDGAWILSSQPLSQCPGDFDINPFEGPLVMDNTTFSVVVEAENLSMPPLHFHPVDAVTMLHEGSFDVVGCSFHMVAVLTIDHLDDLWLEATYAATYDHDASLWCDMLLQGVDLPGGCQTLSLIQGFRDGRAR
jgi:hypothetical protein